MQGSTSLRIPDAKGVSDDNNGDDNGYNVHTAGVSVVFYAVEIHVCLKEGLIDDNRVIEITKRGCFCPLRHRARKRIL